MSKFIVGTDKLTLALFEAGVIRERPENVKRIIIDLNVGEVGKLYVETYMETDTIDVLLGGGLEILKGLKQEGTA